MLHMGTGEVQRGDADARQWALERAGTIGKAVAHARAVLGLTAIELSNRTREIGYPITRATIAKIESNSRRGKFDVAELVVLAAALEVAPAQLLFPNFPDGECRIIPKHLTNARVGWQWLVSSDYEQWDTYTSPRTRVTRDLKIALADYDAAIASFERTYEPKEGIDHWYLSKGVGSELDGSDKARKTWSGIEIKSLYSNIRELRDEVETWGGHVKLPAWVDCYNSYPF